MRSHRDIFVLLLMIILGMALISGCDTQGLGPSDGGSGDGEGEGDGAFEPIDLSGDAEEGEEEGEADEGEFYLNCPGPEESIDFELTLDYDFTVEEPNGKINEWTDNTEGVMLSVQGSTVTQVSPGQLIQGTITGQIGECGIEGETALSLTVNGNCQHGVIHLNITSKYEIYRRTMICNQMNVGTYTEPYLDAPSISADFIIMSGGDTAGSSIGAGGISGNVTWRLTPLGPVPIPTP